MSDSIKHECGLAVVRLLKPLEYYREKYGTALYGLQKLQLLMQKQRNRGQDGAGIATIDLQARPGRRYISRKRSNSSDYFREIFDHVYGYFDQLPADRLRDIDWLKERKPFMGELLLGHLRYGTHGINNIESCHPFLRQSNWISRNLVLAGNFNLTNVDELFHELRDLGQFPKEHSDTVTVLEKIGHFLDLEVQRVFDYHKSEGRTNRKINDIIAQQLDVQRVLMRASKRFDGGYVMAGLIGHGDAFVMRDPHGIRPAYWYQDDEHVVIASERPAILTAMNAHFDSIREITPGHAIIMKKDGRVGEMPFIDPEEQSSCSFERIYFSRGTDRDIYNERKQLGAQVAPRVLQKVKYDLKNTVFSYVPNTAETAFYGLIEGTREIILKRREKEILRLCKKDKLDHKSLHKLMKTDIRMEKLVIKDAKLRTFIADDDSRGDLVSHVYDVTYGIVQDHKDTLVLLDDSIVRGTTLRNSIISMVDRLNPRKIVIVSSAPQIRYPDCYGIDMSRMGEFVAFRALVELLQESNQDDLLEKCYYLCKHELDKPDSEPIVNPVKELYDLFSQDEISARIAQLVTPAHIRAKVRIVYQTLEGLHTACPNHTGDWYFSGNYPTRGGMKTVSRAFINYMEKSTKRSYEV